MKRFLQVATLLLYLASTEIIAQDLHTLAEIDALIENAIANEDYQEAADLKKEKETLIKIEEAVANGDYQLAADLKKGLSDPKALQKKSGANENATVYIFSSRSVGSVGGHVSISNGQDINMEYGDYKKLSLPPGETTFTSNKTAGGVSRLTKDLKSGYSYFLKYTNCLSKANPWVTVRDSKIYFTDVKDFQKELGDLSLVDNEIYSDDLINGLQRTKARAKVFLLVGFSITSINSYKTKPYSYKMKLVVNGTVLIDSLMKHSSFYELEVPPGEILISIEQKAKNIAKPDDPAWELNSFSFAIDDQETKYLKIGNDTKEEVRNSGTMLNYHLVEESEFMNSLDDRDKMIIN